MIRCFFLSLFTLLCLVYIITGRLLGLANRSRGPTEKLGMYQWTKTSLISQKVLSNTRSAISIMVRICKIHSLPRLTNIYRGPQSATFLPMHGHRQDCREPKMEFPRVSLGFYIARCDDHPVWTGEGARDFTCVRQRNHCHPSDGKHRDGRRAEATA